MVTQAAEWAPRALMLALWLFLAARLSPSAWACFTRRTRANDVWRAGYFFVAVLVSGYQIRWFFARSLDGLYLAMHLLSALLAAYLIFMTWAVGRDHHE